MNNILDNSFEFDKLELDMSIVSNVELWLLARCYLNLGEQEKADKLQDRVTDQIKIDRKFCSNQEDQEAYYNNGLHQQIMAPISPYKQTSKKPEKSSCNSCGFKLPSEFKFCPSCGDKI